MEIVLLHYETGDWNERKRAGQVESSAKSICGAFRSLNGQCERNLNGRSKAILITMPLFVTLL